MRQSQRRHHTPLEDDWQLHLRSPNVVHTTPYLRRCTKPTLSAPPAGTPHPATGLLQEYATQGCPAEVGAPWPLETIKEAIATGPHASTLNPAATSFCQGELLERAERGFSIILPAGSALDTFGDRIRISRLASVDQDNRKPRLICNSTAAPNGITPSVNASTDKESAPRAIQFGACLPRFLQKIWEADPAKGTVWLSKWDIYDAFHRCPLQAAHIGAFTYVPPCTLTTRSEERRR